MKESHCPKCFLQWNICSINDNDKFEVNYNCPNCGTKMVEGSSPKTIKEYKFENNMLLKSSFYVILLHSIKHAIILGYKKNEIDELINTCYLYFNKDKNDKV